MGKIFFLICLLFSAHLISGCVVLSFDPIYSDDNKIETPASLIGQWNVIKLTGSDVSDKKIDPWNFKVDKVLVFDEHNVPAEINLVFFKVDDLIYCDVEPASVDEGKINFYWLLLVVPFHSICQVKIEEDTLILTPLNYDWLKDAIEEKKVSVPAYEYKMEDITLFKSEPVEWVHFLRKYGADPEAFSDENAFVFKRNKTSDSH
ncbi:MAG: hypothetical protein P9M03_02550 [Candidatus Theseobacter exili]|nr:hypothetical protein [Candidatus Theseobacter exili]